jgi:predicted enzyme related to lactoylglutathione lyase
MQAKQLILNITSEQPEQLQAFYRDVVQLEPEPRSGGFMVGDALLAIDGHSETHGRAREPHRYLINFMVDDIAAEESRLDALGVPFIRRQGREFWGGIISTFLDPDGNYCQLMEFKGEQ